MTNTKLSFKTSFCDKDITANSEIRVLFVLAAYSNINECAQDHTHMYTRTI